MDYFELQIFLSKIVAFMPYELNFISLKLQILKPIINTMHIIFWHFIVLHLLVLQMGTFYLHFNEALDEIIDYLMIGSIYGYGYFIMCYMQLHATQFFDIIDFIHRNFRQRSSRGEFNLKIIGICFTCCICLRNNFCE